MANLCVKGKPAKRKSLKFRRAHFGMSRQIGAGESGTEVLSAVQVHVRRSSTLESKKSSPHQKADDTASPKKGGMKSARMSFLNLGQHSLHARLPSPSEGANVDEQHMEARVKGSLQCEEMGSLEETPSSPSPDSKVLDDPIRPTDEPTNVSDEANEVLCTRTLSNEGEVISLLQTVTPESENIESRREKKTHSPSTLVQLQSSEEATLRDGVSQDASLRRQFEDVVSSNPEEDTQAIFAIESHDQALSVSTSSPSPSAPSPNTLGTAEIKTDATDLGDTGTESFENLDQEQSGGSNPEPLGHCRLAGIESTKKEPDPCVFHAGELVQPDSSSLGVGQTVDTCNAHGFWKDVKVCMEEHDSSGNTSVMPVTDDSLTKEQIPAPREPASQAASDDVAPRLDALDSPRQVAENSSSITRSGSRFSDETNMLRDFLSRAQARKAARDVPISAETAGLTRPRRSPRKPLAEITNDSPSPDKTQPVSKRRGTPPGPAKLELGELDELDELDEAGHEPSWCRRSTRKRLFTPARPAPEAPSLIPVRRADGGDRVRLQRSLAQELATVTRSNTRRNRGQSKPPKLALKSLPVEPLAVGLARPRGERGGKSVGWDATLVYYHGTSGMGPGKGRRRRRRNSPGEAPGGGVAGAGAGLTKETSEAGHAHARRGSQRRGRDPD